MSTNESAVPQAEEEEEVEALRVALAAAAMCVEAIDVCRVEAAGVHSGRVALAREYAEAATRELSVLLLDITVYGG